MHFPTLSRSMFSIIIFCWMVCLLLPSSSSTPSAAPPPPCTIPPLKDLPICNPDLPALARATSLLSNHSLFPLSHKLSLLFNTNAKPACEPLPAYEWWSEALHGLATSPGTNFDVPPLTQATSFPQVTNLGRTFNRTLWFDIGNAISDEARGMSNAVPTRMSGLSFWAPNVNIVRDARWGRGQETPGEDPFVNSEYAVAFLGGMMGRNDNSQYLKTLPTCKHFAAYSLDKYGNFTRHNFDAVVSDYDLVNTYLVPFRSCVEKAGVRQIMCSYNSVNGIPSCANSFLLKTLLRDSWGFEGHVVSDCGAIVDVFLSHGFVDSFAKAAGTSIRSGCDLDCGFVFEVFGKNAIEEGFLKESDVDVALSRLIVNRIYLGEFDDWEKQPYRKIPPSVVNCEKHQQLALEAARQSIVLLKNSKSSVPALPLDPAAFSTGARSLSVIGPNAKATHVLCGDYCGPAPFYISVLAAIQEDVTRDVSFAPGCQIDSNDTSGFDEALAFAAVSDATILVMGLDESIETEGRDRTGGIGFPGVQQELIQQVANAKQKDSVLILVIIAGSSLDLSWAKESPLVDAIVWGGYPGQSGGQAVVDVLFGKISPAGRMAFTIYKEEYAAQVAFTDMSMVPHASSPGRTYRYFTGTPVYEFGTGLSYTEFEYSWSNREETPSLLKIDLSSKRDDDKAPKYVVEVKNVGIVKSDVVVLAFLEPQFGKTGEGKGGDPLLKELFGFERITLDVHESKTIDFGVMLQVYLERFFETRSLDVARRFVVRIGVGENALLVGRVVVVA